uniref:IS66 family insertion sequence element accessory protein TnpB n=1 Tax=Escherichia coli TaxID=562 RepID=UPI001FCEB129
EKRVFLVILFTSFSGSLVSRIPGAVHLFIFRGRRGDTIKILWADADGLCLFTKRLEEGQFIWPAVRDGKISITRSQLAMLLDKLDWRQPKTSRLNALTML